MIEFLTGPIMLCERWYFIQMNNVIFVVKGQRTKCDVCQHPAITLNRTKGGGWLNVSDDVSVHTQIHASVHTVTLQHLYIHTLRHMLIMHKDSFYLTFWGHLCVTLIIMWHDHQIPFQLETLYIQLLAYLWLCKMLTKSISGNCD